jgi:hypothetical protein
VVPGEKDERVFFNGSVEKALLVFVCDVHSII